MGDIIFNSTNVGIGITPSGSKLHISRPTAGTSIALGSSNGGANDEIIEFRSSYAPLANSSDILATIVGAPSNTGGRVVIRTSQNTTGTLTDRLWVDDVGNVGVGIAPSYKFHVNTATNFHCKIGTGFGWGALTATSPVIELSRSSDGAIGVVSIGSINDGDAVIRARTDMYFYSNSTASMYIREAGNVVIGAPASVTSKLHVADNSSNGNTLTLSNTATTRRIDFRTVLTAGAYNNIVAVDDVGIFWDRDGAVNPTNGLVICPWSSNDVSGIRLTNSGTTLRGNVGVGVAHGTVQRFRVFNSSSSVYYANQFDGTITQNDSGADGGTQIGVFSGNTFAPTASCFLSASHYIQSTMYAASTKSITHAAQLWINPLYNSASNLGTIFTAYGIRIDPGPAHAGTINNGYGLYVARPSYGTNKYTAYLDAIVGIGSTPNAAYSLFVAGTLTDTTNNFQIGNHVGPIFAPTNNTTNICAQYIYVSRSSSAGAVTNSFGLYIDNGGASGAAPTTSYGLYVRSPGLGSTRYTAYFESGVGINTLNTGATYPLIVGGQYASTTSAVVANTSDVRIKKDIAPITEGTEPAIETFKKLNAKKYKYTDAYIADNPSIDSAKTYYGFVAQDLEQVLPDCVKTSEMKCYGGTKNEPEPTVVVDNIKFVDLQRVNMLSFEAIKELVGLVESLQARVALLENK